MFPWPRTSQQKRVAYNEQEGHVICNLAIRRERIDVVTTNESGEEEDTRSLVGIQSGPQGTVASAQQ